MHERCWTLMTRMIDVDLIMSNLREFCQALWHTRVSVGQRSYYFLDHKYHEENRWSHCRALYGDKFLRNPRRFVARDTRGLTCSDKVYSLRDPWSIPEIWIEINRQSARWQREQVQVYSADVVTKPKSRKSVARVNHQQSRDSGAQKKKVLRSWWRTNASLPAELIMIIIDYLPTCRDVRLLMWVFPQWSHSVPMFYWRRLFIREMMLEDHESSIPGPDECHWQRLYYGIDRITASSHGLRNRQRILSILEGIKTAFMDSLGRHSPGRIQRRYWAPAGLR